MKKIIYILSWIGTIFSLLISNVFAFVELRTLIAGDWKLAENPTMECFVFIFRSLFFLMMFFNAVHVIIRLVNHQKMSTNDLIFNAALLGASIFTLMFYEWFFVIILVVSNLITLLVRLKIEEKAE